MYISLSEALSDISLIFPNGNESAISVIKDKLAELLERTADRRQYSLCETLVVLLDYWNNNLSHKTVFDKWKKLQEHIEQLPYSPHRIEVFHSDARQTPLKERAISLVLTSPPYINVFNYHQQYRASVEALNWNVLEVAKSEIGSNRKHRSNRFLTVIQYCLDMAQTFRELLRVCVLGTPIILVVGRESRIRGVQFYNGELITEIAHRGFGLDLAVRQERSFTNRFGERIYEDILHFKAIQDLTLPNYLDRARSVATDMLTVALCEAPEAMKSPISQALDSVDKVLPSSIFTNSGSVMNQGNRE